jgi:hypothetical protein
MKLLKRFIQATAVLAVLTAEPALADDKVDPGYPTSTPSLALLHANYVPNIVGMFGPSRTNLILTRMSSYELYRMRYLVGVEGGAGEVAWLDSLVQSYATAALWSKYINANASMADTLDGQVGTGAPT